MIPPRNKRFAPFFVVTLLLSPVSVLFAARSAVPPAAVTAMEPLTWMIGNWSGQGTYSDREGRHAVLQSESIQSELEGALLVVRGTGRTPDADGKAGEVSFRAFGVFSAGDSAGTFRFAAWQGGQFVDARATLRDDGSLVWGFPTPDGGEVEYSIRRVEPDVWHETGSYRRPGMDWVPTFEMTLRRETKP